MVYLKPKDNVKLSKIYLNGVLERPKINIVKNIEKYLS